jgi:hypothetical protein
MIIERRHQRAVSRLEQRPLPQGQDLRRAVDGERHVEWRRHYSRNQQWEE